MQRFASPPYVGVAKICLPNNISRADLLKQYYRKNVVDLMMPSGTMAKDCYVSGTVISSIKFPETYKELGSTVVFVTERNDQRPIVIAVLDDVQSRYNLKEESFHIQRSIDNSLVDIFANGDGELFVNVEAEENAVVKINVKGEGAKTELNSDGTTTINSQGEININSLSKVVHNFINSQGEKEAKLEVSQSGLDYEDTSGNKFRVDKTDNKIKMFEGSEPLTKGTALKTQLEQNNAYLTQLQAAISSALVILDSLGVPASSTFNTAMAGATKGNYSNINSQKSFTD